MDLSDEQWAVVAPHLPERTCTRGRPRRDDREILNGILWVMRTGAPWADMPDRYPPYQTCHRRFQEWVNNGTLERILRALVLDVKERGDLDLTECLSSQKRGPRGGQDQAAPKGFPRYEAHGSGRRRWSSYRPIHFQCFTA